MPEKELNKDVVGLIDAFDDFLNADWYDGSGPLDSRTENFYRELGRFPSTIDVPIDYDTVNDGATVFMFVAIVIMLVFIKFFKFNFENILVGCAVGGMVTFVIHIGNSIYTTYIMGICL